MDWKAFATIFISVFLAELGDKTQLATLLFATDGKTSRWLVFAAAATALVATTAIGVLVGQQIARWIAPKHLSLVAGFGFIAIGVWVVVNTLKN